MTRMDPPSGDLMANLRRQEVNRKINSFKAVGKRNPVTSVDVVPLQITVPPTAKMWSSSQNGSIDYGKGTIH
ncbi:hypothetical protein ACSQ67_001031 [Phaseolus vulgaris]